MFKIAAQLQLNALKAMKATKMFSSSPIPPSNKKSNGGLLLGLTAVTAGIGYYFTVGNQRQVTTSALNPQTFTDFKLKEIHDINHNTKLFRFELPPNQVFGVPVTSCVVTKAPSKGGKGMVIRPYTPASDEDQTGFFDFVIKLYKGGPMSEHIHSLKPGDTLSIKGPFPKLDYVPNKYEHVGMLAGGTGITPMLQILRKSLKDKNDKTKITLVFGNQTEKDILFRRELDEFQQKHSDRFKVHYILDKAPAGFDGSSGHINKEIIQKYMPDQNNEKSIVLVCGPDPMYHAICGPKNPDKSQGELKGTLKELGYKDQGVYKF